MSHHHPPPSTDCTQCNYTTTTIICCASAIYCSRKKNEIICKTSELIITQEAALVVVILPSVSLLLLLGWHNLGCAGQSQWTAVPEQQPAIQRRWRPLNMYPKKLQFTYPGPAQRFAVWDAADEWYDAHPSVHFNEIKNKAGYAAWYLLNVILFIHSFMAPFAPFM